MSLPFVVVVLAAVAGAAAPDGDAVPAAPLTPAEVAHAVAAVDGLAPPQALRALVAGSEEDVEEFMSGALFWRVLGDDDAMARSPLAQALAARDLVEEGDWSWFVLAAYRLRGRGEPLDVARLVDSARARRERITREKAAAQARQIRARLRVIGNPIELVDRVEFDAGAATIRDDTRSLLEVVAKLLQANPGIKLVEVRGHASPGERDAATLARHRAEAVSDDLSAHGVAPERLVTASTVRRARPRSLSRPPDPPSRSFVNFAILRRPRIPGQYKR